MWDIHENEGRYVYSTGLISKPVIDALSHWYEIGSICKAHLLSGDQVNIAGAYLLGKQELVEAVVFNPSFLQVGWTLLPVYQKVSATNQRAIAQLYTLPGANHHSMQNFTTKVLRVNQLRHGMVWGAKNGYLAHTQLGEVNRVLAIDAACRVKTQRDAILFERNIVLDHLGALVAPILRSISGN